MKGNLKHYYVGKMKNKILRQHEKVEELVILNTFVKKH